MATTSETVQLVLAARDETANAIDGVKARLEGLKGSLREIGRIAAGVTLGNLGVQGLDAAVRGVADFGKGLISVNADMELTKQRLAILYGSAAEGAQAFAFLKQNEITKPFDIASIMGASTQLVAFRQNIVPLLPALENIAGAMGDTLPHAADAFTAALAGRFQMLRHLGISRADLQAAGAQINAGGHLTDPNSLATAIENLGNTRFKGGADKLGQTWTGLMSSMSSQWTYFQANLGQGAFSVLEKQLSGIVHTLQDPKMAASIQQFETGLGAGLAEATTAAIDFGKRAAPYVGSALAFMARAFPIVEGAASAAFAFVGGVVSSFTNWLQNTGFPAIQKVVTAIGNAWITLYPPVKQVLQAVTDDVGTFFGAITTQAGPLMQGLAGAFKVGLGAVQAIFGGGLDLLSGNWAKFQNDLQNGADLIATGVVQAFGGLAAAFVPLANSLFTPWTQLAIGIRGLFDTIGQIIGGFAGGAVQGFLTLVDKLYAPWTTLAIGVREVFKGIVGVVGGFVGTMVKAGTDIGNALLTPINKAIDAMRGAGSMLDKIPGMSHVTGGLAGMHDLSLGGAQGNADAASNAVTDWAARHMPGIDKGQTLHAGIDPAAVGKGIADAFAAWFKVNAPGIDPHQRITGGRTIEQAQADIAARTQQIVTAMGLKPGEARGVTFSTTGGPGAEILKTINDLFKGLGGKFSMEKLLAEFGLKDLGKGKYGFNGPAIPNSLPVDFGSPGGTTGANSPTARQYLFEQTRGLGALTANFGQAIVTPAGQAQARDASATIAALTQQVAALQAQIHRAQDRARTDEAQLAASEATAAATTSLVGLVRGKGGPRNGLAGRGLAVPS